MTDGQVITYQELEKTCPQRTSYMNTELVEQCRAQMENHVDMQFLPVHIHETYLPVVGTKRLRQYAIAMFGILRSGEKITVVIDNVYPMFEVRVRDAQHVDAVLCQIKYGTIDLHKHQVVHGKTIKCYNDTTDFLQLYFRTTDMRKKCIELLKDCETTHDDPTCYYRAVCRDMLVPWTTWCTLSGYKHVKGHKFFATRYTVLVGHQHISACADAMDDPQLRDDLTVEACFDIETRDPVQQDIPQPESHTAEMCNISLVFTLAHAALFPPGTVSPQDAAYPFCKPTGNLVCYNITTMMTAPMPNRITVMCRDMQEMIMAFAVIWRRMRPDYAVGFNSDHYDWRWIAEKARQYKIMHVLEQYMSLVVLHEYRLYEGAKWVDPTAMFTCEGATSYSYKWWNKYQFKISAEIPNYTAACLNYPGYVCVDLMPQLRALCGNPEKYSLHKFLEMYGLGDKVDMPYQEMFARFTHNRALLTRIKQHTQDLSWPSMERVAQQLGISADVAQAAHDMRAVAEYCFVDSFRCHDLLVKTQLIPDKRLMGALSYTTTDDCVYRANGMKVRNMIIAQAQVRGLHVSNRPPATVEAGKYPGAHVIKPDKSLAAPKPSPQELRKGSWQDMPEPVYQQVLQCIATHGIHTSSYPQPVLDEQPQQFREWLEVDTHYPIAGLDFNSLYPSLIMAYNFSPEMMVHTLEDAVRITGMGKLVHPVSFMFNSREIKGWSVRSSYTLHQHDIEAVMQKLRVHENSTDRNALELLLAGAEFGLFPSVLKMLFELRVSVKADLKPVNHRKEAIELMGMEEFATHRDEYEVLMLRWNYLNSKQRAIKVLMNTFYGESGNSNSPLRVLAIAGGITSAGQYNLKKVAELVQKMQCRIYYGDTDSVYISMPHSVFAEADRLYYSAQCTRQDYYETVVAHSFVEKTRIQNAVNEALRVDNGTEFLRLAFEEVLYPARFFCKKKYAGIAHEGVYNRHPKDIFVRGLEYVKKGTSEMLKDISKELLWSVFAVDNQRTLRELVESKIEYIYTHPISDFSKFIKTGSYKPNKKNVAAHTFHRRMSLLGMAPAALERYSYVIVRKYPYKHDLRGRQVALSIGDQMEYAVRAQELGMDINLDYYMSSNVCGQFARFISYDQQFHYEPRDASDEAYNDSEKKNIDAAKRHIMGCYQRWNKTQLSKGPALQALYKKVNGVFHSTFHNIMHVSDLWKFDAVEKTLFQDLLDKIEHITDTESRKDSDRRIARMTLTSMPDVICTRNAHSSLLVDRQLRYRTQVPQIHDALRQRLQTMQKLFGKRDNILEKYTSLLQTQVGVKNERFETLEPIIACINNLDVDKIHTDMEIAITQSVTDLDLRMLSEIDTLYLRLLAISKLVRTTELLVHDLNIFINCKIGSQHHTEINHLDDLDDWMEDNL